MQRCWAAFLRWEFLTSNGQIGLPMFTQILLGGPNANEEDPNPKGGQRNRPRTQPHWRLDQQTLREFGALAMPLVRKLSAEPIRAIRARTRMSQAVFAAVLNTSTSTAQKWEIGATERTIA